MAQNQAGPPLPQVQILGTIDAIMYWHPVKRNGTWSGWAKHIDPYAAPPSYANLAITSHLFNMLKYTQGSVVAYCMALNIAIGRLEQYGNADMLLDVGSRNSIEEIHNNLFSTLSVLEYITYEHTLNGMRYRGRQRPPANRGIAKKMLQGMFLCDRAIFETVALHNHRVGSALDFLIRTPDYNEIYDEEYFAAVVDTLWTEDVVDRKDRGLLSRAVDLAKMSSFPVSRRELNDLRGGVRAFADSLNTHFEYTPDGFPIFLDPTNLAKLRTYLPNRYYNQDDVTSILLVQFVKHRKDRVDNACNKEHSQIPEVQELSTVQVWYCWFLLSCSKGNLDLLTGKPVRFFESNHAHSGGIGHILYGRPMTHGFTVPNPTSVVTDYDENLSNIFLRHFSVEKIHWACGRNRPNEVRSFIRGLVRYTEQRLRGGDFRDIDVEAQTRLADLCQQMLGDNAWDPTAGGYGDMLARAAMHLPPFP